MLVALLGFLLAMGQCAAIGPVNAEALRRGLARGFRAALAVQLGSILGDGLWAALAFAGVGALFTLGLFEVIGGLAGGLLLGWLAWHGWHDAAIPSSSALLTEAIQRPQRLPAFWSGLLLSVVNPGSAAFWAAAGATLLASHLTDHGPRTLALFAGGYYLALVVWSFSFATAAWQAGLRLPARAQFWLERAAALLLAVLAVLAIGSVLRRVFLIPAE
jgi:chemosensory pili system protein ChpE